MKSLADYLYYHTDLGVLYCGDCLEILPLIPDNSVDLVLTDPPYGIDKAEWDNIYPVGFENHCLRIGKSIAIMCGMWAIPECIKSLKETYMGIIALRNANGMTYSPLGFGNWIPCIIAKSIKKRGQDLLSFNVSGDKPEHPSPKPIDAILKATNRLSEASDLILDPFFGSGTTGVACEKLNRRWIGIEIEPRYAEIAKRRIEVEARQLKLFK
jgi:site-specific DNA-methyltransferase (adenine-specific)